MSTYHHGNLKTALKECAITLIETRGIHHLNLRELARLCGVSATSVYRHYKNKESLLAVIAEEGFNQLYQTMLTLEGRNKFEATCNSYVQFGLHHAVQFNIMFGSLIDKKNHPGLLEAGNRLYELLEQEIEKHSIGAPSQAANLSRMVWSAVHGVTVLALDKQFANHMEASVDDNTLTKNIVKTLIRVLEGDPECTFLKLTNQ